MLWFINKIKSLEKSVEGLIPVARVSGTGPLIIGELAIPVSSAMHIIGTYIGIHTANGEAASFVFSYLVRNWNGTITIDSEEAIAAGGTFNGSVPSPTIDTGKILFTVQAEELTFWAANWQILTVTSI
ncbi:MAG TPA: hypothetical protein VEB42_02350 [Chitinophagaceae bacterium]|nr:hypothetical protein [Chitinophagaceae bacterium]